MWGTFFTDEELASYTLPAVMRMAAALSGRSDEEIITAMGWETKYGYRMLNPQDNYWPGMPSLPHFCAVVGNDIIPRWICAAAQNMARVGRAAPMDAAHMVRSLAELFAEVGDVARKGQDAIADDGRIYVHEARKIRRELEDLLRVGADVMEHLAAVTERDPKRVRKTSTEGGES